MRRPLEMPVEGILADASARVDIPRSSWDDEHVSWYAFPQLWGSTALGFGGIGMHAMTTAQTIVVMSETREEMVVYFAGRFAYQKKYGDRLLKALQDMKMPSVKES